MLRCTQHLVDTRPPVTSIMRRSTNKLGHLARAVSWDSQDEDERSDAQHSGASENAEGAEGVGPGSSFRSSVRSSRGVSFDSDPNGVKARSFKDGSKAGRLRGVSIGGPSDAAQQDDAAEGSSDGRSPAGDGELPVWSLEVADAREINAARKAPPPPSRTKWTRRVPHPVLIGHAASLSQARLRAREEARVHRQQAADSRGDVPRLTNHERLQCPPARRPEATQPIRAARGCARLTRAPPARRVGFCWRRPSAASSTRTARSSATSRTLRSGRAPPRRP
jgi:hypothetical protein